MVSNDRKGQAQAHLCAVAGIARGEFAIEAFGGGFGQGEADAETGRFLRQPERSHLVEFVEARALVGDHQLEPRPDDADPEGDGGAFVQRGRIGRVLHG